MSLRIIAMTEHSAQPFLKIRLLPLELMCGMIRHKFPLRTATTSSFPTQGLSLCEITFCSLLRPNGIETSSFATLTWISVQCAVCSVQCAVCSVQCAVCSVQCAVCSVQCAVYSNESILLLRSHYWFCQTFSKQPQSWMMRTSFCKRSL